MTGMKKRPGWLRQEFERAREWTARLPISTRPVVLTDDLKKSEK